jgi:phosphoribosyl 1,2-cyclic phosphate phosphodiesterase
LTFTFLGTGTSQGVPVVACDCDVCQSTDPKDKRLRSSLLVEHDGKTVIVDTGPDFRQQMLAASVQQLDAIIYTHEHRDHTAGLDDIRAFNYKQRVPADIYATPHVQAELKKQFDYIFARPDYPGIPKVALHSIGLHPFAVAGMEVVPIQVYHYLLPVLGFRFGNFTYITDANRIPAEEMPKLRGTRILVLNVLRKESHISHFTLEQALQIVDDIRPEMAFFTHISHQLGRHAEVSKDLPKGTALAYDGLRVSL